MRLVRIRVLIEHSVKNIENVKDPLQSRWSFTCYKNKPGVESHIIPANRLTLI